MYPRLANSVPVPSELSELTESNDRLCASRIKKANFLCNKIIQLSNNQMKCILCGDLLQKSAPCIEHHVNGPEHRKNNELLSEHGIGFLNDKKIFCKPCNLILPKNESVADHINSVCHSNWMKLMPPIMIMGEIENFHRHLAQESDHLFCTLCKIPIPCDRDMITDHLASLQHMNLVYECLSKPNGMFNMPDEKVWCKPCNLTLENDVAKLLKHIRDDRDHITWLVELDERAQFEGVKIEKYFATLEETKVFCQRCDMKIDCNSKALEAHVHSQCHLCRVVEPSDN